MHRGVPEGEYDQIRRLTRQSYRAHNSRLERHINPTSGLRIEAVPTDHMDSGITADLILYNANVITLELERPRAEMVAIEGSRVLAVGSNDDLSLFKGAGTKLSDCGGGTVVPGFNDAHCHPIAHAISVLSVDCSPKAVKDIADIQARIRYRAAQTSEGKWIRAAYYDEFHLQERRPPNRWELDQAAPRHPVVLVHSTGQSCVLNSLALRLAGITRDTPAIHRDPETCEPDGLIPGRNEQVARAIPPWDEEDLEEGMKLVNREYLSHGITSLHDTSWTNGLRHWQLWQRFIERGIVSSRVSMLVGTEFLDEFQRVGLLMGSGGNRLRVGGMKLALDESSGCPHPPQEDINRLALQACEAGFPVAFHVSDIPILEASLAAIKFVCQQVPEAEHRFRLEHCPICPPGLLLRLRASRAIVVTQPSLLYCLGQRYQEDVSPDQTGWLWPIGSFRRFGVKVAFSSDSPLVTSNPLIGLYAAVTRQTETGQKLAPQEGISALEALRMYTMGGAHASFEEGVKGSIRPGKLADLVVLNGDPTQSVAEQPGDLRVVQTIIDGKVVWES